MIKTIKMNAPQVKLGLPYYDLVYKSAFLVIEVNEKEDTALVRYDNKELNDELNGKGRIFQYSYLNNNNGITQQILKKGMHVLIHKTDAGGKSVVEGEAVLLRLQMNGSDSEYWTVQFVSDGFKCERFVWVDYNPTKVIRTAAEKGWR